MSTPDSFDLARFVTAQEPVMTQVLAELKDGCKRTHWMWFVFPQLRGLGHSPTAQFYGIGSLDEARAYLAHPLLGSRLDLCTRTVIEAKDRSVHDIFGAPDDLKFHSSMTLFAVATDREESAFRLALSRWWQGEMDGKTLRLLGVAEPG